MKLGDNVDIIAPLNVKTADIKNIETRLSARVAQVKLPDKSAVTMTFGLVLCATGVSIDYKDKPALFSYMNKVYNLMDPNQLEKWNDDQDNFWNNRNAPITQSIFEALRDGSWKCVHCELPSNPNFARRIQDLKEFGYTISTNTKMYCPNCRKNTTHLMMLHIPRIELAGNGYETWSSTLRKRIIKVLGGIDVYENVQSKNVLPDHKFSEIRWDDNTKAENPDEMTDEEIRNKFQLLTYYSNSRV